MSDPKRQLDRTRSAWELAKVGLRNMPVTDAAKLANEIALELLALGLVSKASK